MKKPSPIDIVYLWVNGRDPAWRAKRQQAHARLSAAQRSAMAVYGNVEGRFRDNDELRYNLRALERFFPEHGHVYVITDGQRPDWLRPSKHLTVVDHSSLMPAAALPTFDSGNIETYIHRIPNLSERFFYLNDDVFFGAPVNPKHWFSAAGLYVTWSHDAAVSDEPMRPDSTSLFNGCRLSAQWFSEHTMPHYRHTFRTFAHSPRPMLRSMLQRIELQAPEMFSPARSTVFRVWDKPTVVSDFVLRWALATGLASIRDYDYLHVSTGDADVAEQLEQLESKLGAIEFFCINDTSDNADAHDPSLTEVRQALARMFSQPSSFERGASGVKAVNTAQELQFL
jgi:Stealth protein CR2, conserved region 2/Stealth protein CR1, conserved region 1/Stealth protein CR4, conserved region 4